MDSEAEKVVTLLAKCGLEEVHCGNWRGGWLVTGRSTLKADVDVVSVHLVGFDQKLYFDDRRRQWLLVVTESLPIALVNGAFIA